MGEEEFKNCPKCGVIYTTQFNVFPNYQNHDCSLYQRWTRRLEDISLESQRPLGNLVFAKEDIRILEVKSKHGLRLVEYLNFMARFAGEPFLYPKPDYFKLFLMLDGKTCVGYAAWNYLKGRNSTIKEYEKSLTRLSIKEGDNERRSMVLRQIFIRPRFQRQGCARILVEQCQKYLQIKGVWFVEDANDKFRRWLVKHEYAHVEGDMIVGDKVHFTGILR